MLTYVTVSAKVRRELYEKLKRYGVSISGVIRKALEEEVKRREEEEIRRALDNVQRMLLRIKPKEIVKVIRETRDER